MASQTSNAYTLGIFVFLAEPSAPAASSHSPVGWTMIIKATEGDLGFDLNAKRLRDAATIVKELSDNIHTLSIMTAQQRLETITVSTVRDHLWSMAPKFGGDGIVLTVSSIPEYVSSTLNYAEGGPTLLGPIGGVPFFGFYREAPHFPCRSLTGSKGG